MLLIWSKFILLLIIIFIFGTKATKSADIIAEKKGLTRAFMGVVFISVITSLPELFTGISAASFVGSADLAVGEIIGSCIFNLFIIAIIELFFRKSDLYKITGKENILPHGFSFIIITFLTLAISLKFQITFLNINLYSVIIFISYIIFMKIIFQERKTKSDEKIYQHKNLRREVITFIISAIIIVAVGIYLPFVGKEIALIMNWNHSFVGVIFLAFVTSFPELIVSFATAKIGAFEMFLGNIAGSNLFNIAIILVIDIFYLKGDIYSSVSKTNVSAGIIALLMNFVVIFAMARGSSYKFFRILSLNAIILIFLYLLNVILIF